MKAPKLPWLPPPKAQGKGFIKKAKIPICFTSNIRSVFKKGLLSCAWYEKPLHC